MGEVISPTHTRTPTIVGNHDDLDLDGVPTGLDRSPSFDSDLDLEHDEEHDSSQALGDHIKSEPAPPQKRKGGRKPVCFGLVMEFGVVLMSDRFMPRVRRENNGIVRLRQHFERGEQNTLNNWRRQ